jgi:hypothetical protein
LGGYTYGWLTRRLVAWADFLCYDRGILVSKLGGEVTYKGFRVYLSFRF